MLDAMKREPRLDDLSVDHSSQQQLQQQPFTVTFLGLDSNEYSPGVFIRMAANIMQRCSHLFTQSLPLPSKLLPAAASSSSQSSQSSQSSHKDNQRNHKSSDKTNNGNDNVDVDVDNDGLCPRRHIRFVVLGVGKIASAMKNLIKLHKLLPYFTILRSSIKTPTPSALIDVIRASDLLVDPSPTHSVHTSVYPMASLMSIPILRFNSSNAHEWSLEGQVGRLVGRLIGRTHPILLLLYGFILYILMLMLMLLILYWHLINSNDV